MFLCLAYSHEFCDVCDIVSCNGTQRAYHHCTSPVLLSSASRVRPSLISFSRFAGNLVKKWNRRWFVLEYPLLHYYATPEDTKPQGTIDCTGVVLSQSTALGVPQTVFV